MFIRGGPENNGVLPAGMFWPYDTDSFTSGWFWSMDRIRSVTGGRAGVYWKSMAWRARHRAFYRVQV